MVHRNDPDVITRLLTTPGRWAVVGLSSNSARAAFGVARYVQAHGHTIVPVHPKAETVHGADGVRTLAEVDGPIDVVDVFVNSRLAGEVVDQAIAVGAGAVWLQLGVVDEEAAERARAAGLDVVMDTCPAIEGPRRAVTGAAVDPVRDVTRGVPAADGVRPVDSSTNLEFVASPFEASPPPLSRSGPASRRVV